MKIIKLGTAWAALALLVVAEPGGSFAQTTNLNFNGISANVEGALRLSWNSTSNEIYEIDEADSLIDTNTGSITWNVLYEDYPSHGTNTFWLDTGNYFADTEIVHPKYSPMRFYRIALVGTNNAPSVPSVWINSLTNGTSTNGEMSVVVNAATDQAFLSPKLYVDGQEMNDPDDVTNYFASGTNYITATFVLNTTEWPNGDHVLFATARCQTGASGNRDIPDIGYSYGVSSYVPVTFSNLITRVSFSQPFFAPEDGQTQQVTAVFEANVNWTLQIQDSDFNSVRTTNGSGGSLFFAWDGTDNTGTDVPVGNYTYLITAETNGLALPLSDGGSGGGGAGDPPSPGAEFSRVGTDSGETETWVESRSGAIVPFALYPPGIDTNGFTFFEEPLGWNPYRERAAASLASFGSGGGGGAAAAYSGPSGQTSRAPKRPPINPVKGRAGVYGIAYDTYAANGSGFSLSPPFNGLPGIPTPPRVALEGETVAHSTFNYPPLRESKQEANAFIAQMKKLNWSQGFARVDDQLKASDLKSSGSNIFNTVRLGVFLGHGTYGTGQDFNANGAKQMYFPITAGHSAQYVKMSEMSLGGATTNGLKWMAFSTCNSLQHTAWSSMQSAGVKPYNSNLHLILGSDSVTWTAQHAEKNWALYMIKGKGTNAPMTIRSAWYQGFRDAYAEGGFNYTNSIVMAVSGDSACQNDKISANSTPGGGSFYDSNTVWP